MCVRALELKELKGVRTARVERGGGSEYLHHVFEREKRGASVHRRKCERCLTVPARVKGRGQ
jgi:hypothetical protein